jgi:hypothetical protein
MLQFNNFINGNICKASINENMFLDETIHLFSL